MHNEVKKIILDAARKAREETENGIEPEFVKSVEWPVECKLGPGLEGAIACESKIGYVNGKKGRLIYRGYDIFDLCAHSSFEEVSFLLLHGYLPSAPELKNYNQKLARYRSLHELLRLFMNFPIEKMNTMASLRLGTLLLRQKASYRDKEIGRPNVDTAIAADEDSIAMEKKPEGRKHAIFEFKGGKKEKWRKINQKWYDSGTGLEACYRLIAGLPTIAAAIHRIRMGKMPIDPDPGLSHAANFLYMINNTHPTEKEERIMDISLILHADHGMNASTFASMLIASTLSDIYFSIGSGIAALNGPLHGGANEKVIHTLQEIKEPSHVKGWFKKTLAKKKKIMGFGHRVYNTYDPRARILGPLAKYLAAENEEHKKLYTIAETLEKEVVTTLGKEKGIFPNVDFFSGIVYMCLGIPTYLYTPIFTLSRVSGWTARVMEYLKNNRIFRPRAVYTGDFNKQYVPANERSQG
jgi:citrate synthase